MAFPILGRPRPAFVDSSGSPLASGTVTVLEPTDDTNKATYPTADDADAATNANSNPITLNARGEVPSGFFGVDGEKYKIVVKDSDGTTIYTDDDIQLPSRLTAAQIGAGLYPTIAAETTAGITPSSFQYPPLNILRYGATISDSVGTTNHTAITNAITVAKTLNGGHVIIPTGDFKVDDQITIYRGVHLVGEGGTAATNVNQSVLRYIGSTFQDFIVNNSGDADQMQLRHLQICGGAFQTGKARWVVRFSAFNRGCAISDCEIRDGVGLLRIDNGYYGSVNRNIIGIVTPDQTASGVSDAEWAEVYGATVAPVMLTDMNGCDLSRNTFNKLVGEHITASQATQAIRVTGQSVNCSSWIIETTGVDFSTYSPRVTHLINNKGYACFDGLYIEACDVTTNIFQCDGEAITSCHGFSVYNCNGTNFVNNQGMGDATFSDGIAYRMDFQRAWFANTNGLGAGGDVKFSNVTWRSGEPTSDVFDTQGLTNELGATDGTHVRFHNQRQVFPRIVTGLSVSNSSDANGHYVEITGGVLLSERNEYVVTKARSNNDTTAISSQRLRPTTASKWYRIFVGKAGNIFLEQYDTEPTDPVGDWIAEFETDGSTEISSTTANPRLSIRGTYIPGSDLAEMSFTTKPSDTDKRYQNGDRAINNDPATTEAAFWVFDESAPTWLDGEALS